MNTYGARIFDRSSGRFVFTAPGVRSPDRVGEEETAMNTAFRQFVADHGAPGGANYGSTSIRRAP